MSQKNGKHDPAKYSDNLKRATELFRAEEQEFFAKHGVLRRSVEGRLIVARQQAAELEAHLEQMKRRELARAQAKAQRAQRAAERANRSAAVQASKAAKAHGKPQGDAGLAGRLEALEAQLQAVLDVLTRPQAKP